MTSPARALLDAAPALTDRELERAYDQMLVSRLASERDLRAVIARARGQGARLAELLDAHSPPTLTRSEAEERMLALIRAAGLPEPLVNHRVLGMEVDFFWPRERLVLEVDGFRYHAPHGAFERDRERDATLQAHGISTMRVTWRQLVHESFAVIARLAQALALAEADQPGTTRQNTSFPSTIR